MAVKQPNSHESSGQHEVGNSMQLQPQEATYDPEFNPIPKGSHVFFIPACIAG